MIELRQGDFDAFFQVPFAVYGAARPYVSPMRADLRRFLSVAENPLFAGRDDLAFFTAHRDGRPIGRITAHLHRASNDLHGEARGCFGYFDCADDAGAARALLGAAEDWTRARGCTRIEGNFNLTAMQQIGVMTAGFEAAPYTDQIWSPPWLPALLEGAGYTAHFPMTTIELDLTRLDPARLIGPREAALAARLEFAPVTRATLMQRMEDARLILNTAFQGNPMFVPVTAEEFAFQACEMKWVIDPRISTVARLDGRAVGAIIAIPDLNPLVRATGARIGWQTPWHYLRYRMTRDRCVVIFQGVMPDQQGAGLNPVMLAHVTAAMKAAGYRRMGGTWIADVNGASLRQVEKIGGRALHRLHLFAKPL